MAAKKQYELNPTSAAILGINDELRALYLNLQNIYDEVYENLKSMRPNTTPYKDQLDRAAYSRVRRVIDDLLPKISSVFTEEYVSLHPNKSAMAHFSISKFNNPFEDFYNPQGYISYAAFLGEMQDFVIRAIVQRKRYTLPKISYETVGKNVIRHIQDTVAKKHSEHIIWDKGERTEVLKETIIVFDNPSTISCNRNNHVVESVAVPVSSLVSPTLVLLPIHHCTTCDRYFIGSETLKIYEKLYGRLLIRDIRDGADSSEYKSFGESELHRTGYNVRKGGMRREERQAFLSMLITKKIMHAFGIRRDLEKAIKIFDSRPEYTDAVAKWRDDLFFVSNQYGGRE